MGTNYFIILVLAVLSMILGMIWYGPLFGRKWMEVVGMDPDIMRDETKRKEMGKNMWKYYLIQFFLSIMQSVVIFFFFKTGGEIGFNLMLIIWAGFIVPVLGGSALWSGDKTAKCAWLRFGIQAGYQLVFMSLAVLILTYWK